VKRYDVGSKDGLGFFCNGYGREDEHGEWVRAEDAAELEKQLAEARAALRDLMVLADNKFIDEDDGSYWNFWRNDHAAALKAAKEGEK
jgi:hypothetical protein